MPRIRILFDLKKQYYFSSFVSILKALSTRPDVATAFHVGSDSERKWGIVPVSRKRRIEGRLREQGFQVVESPGGFDAVVGGDALSNPGRFGDVPLFVSDHGPGTKTLRFRNIARCSERRHTVFVEGRYWMETIRKFGFEDAAEWKMTGVPKLDPFFWRGYYDRGKILRSLGLDPAKKTVLFAPSYRPSCIPFIKDKVAALAPASNVLIKLHPYSWGGKYAPARQSRRYVRLAARNHAVTLVPREHFDIHPLVFAADTVISDTSSALALCLAVGRVGVVADFPYPKLRHSDGMPLLSEPPGEYLKDIFVHFGDPHLLADAVQRALNPGREHLRRLMEYRDYYFTGLDGRSGERAAEIILEGTGRSE